MVCSIWRGALLCALLTFALLVPCTGSAKKSSSTKAPDSVQSKAATSVSIKASSPLNVSFGTALKQKSKRPKGKASDRTKCNLAFNANFNWDRDSFDFTVKEAGSVSLTIDMGKEVESGAKCIYRNVMANGEKLHDKEALGPISVEVTAEARKKYRITFESKKVTATEAAKMDKGDEGGDEDKPAKKEKKSKKGKKKKKGEEEDGGSGDGE